MKVNVGDVFNRFTVIGDGTTYISKSGRSREKTYRCMCECGKIVDVRSGYLMRGTVKSCGCYQKEFLKAGLAHMKHGGRRTRLYTVWKSMNERCKTKSSSAYKHYGGRGISVCDEWNDYAVFYEWSNKSGYKEGLTIERIDVNGNYTPDNCRWATMQEQANNRRTTHWIDDNGEKYSMADFCRKHSLNYNVFSNNLRKGYSLQTAYERAIKCIRQS